MGERELARFSPEWAKNWWLGERLRCPSHLETRLSETIADQHFREGRFLAVMGFILGIASLVVDAVMLPDNFWQIAAVRLGPTIPLQIAALAMPRERLGWQKLFLGASLCAFAASLVYASSLAPPGPAIALAFGPVVLVGIVIPLMPYDKRQLAVFVAFFVVPASIMMLTIGIDADLVRTLLAVMAIVASGAFLIAMRLRRLERQGALATLLAQERARDLEESNARLTQLSMQDPLTSLANRRWTETAFDRDYALSAEEAPGHTAALLLDLDHFKDFNDRWGHDVGDRCLKAVAEVMRHAAVAHCGLAARIGGEEFVILIRAFDRAEATGLAEEIRLGIERIEIRIDDRSESVTCTASIGVAVHEGRDAPELSIMLKRADEALYEAKRDGRNRFKLAA